MILLDTNIISEMMKQVPNPSVIKWVSLQEVTQLFVSSITIAEIGYGLNVLPEGRRRTMLENGFKKALLESFTDRILSFDENAAYLYGKIMGDRKKQGRPLSLLDGQIVAIALLHGAALATRNIRDFEDCALQLIDPFS